MEQRRCDTVGYKFTIGSVLVSETGYPAHS